MSKKIKVPVIIRAEASKCVGEIEINNLEEYEEKAERFLEENDYPHISTNCSNDFDISDTELMPFDKDDFEFYTNGA